MVLAISLTYGIFDYRILWFNCSTLTVWVVVVLLMLLRFKQKHEIAIHVCNLRLQTGIIHLNGPSIGTSRTDEFNLTSRNREYKR